MKPSVVLWANLLCSMVALASYPAHAQSRSVIDGRIGNSVNSAQSGSVAGQLLKFELDVGKTQRTLTSAIWQPGNNIFLQHFDPGTLIAWDFSSGTQIGEFAVPAGSSPIYFDPALSRVLVIAGGQLSFVSRPPAGAVNTARVIDDRISAAAVSADGRWIFAGTSGGEVIKIAAADAAIAWRRKLFDAAPTEIVAAPNGSRAAVLANRAMTFDESGKSAELPPDVKKLGAYAKDGSLSYLSQDNRIVKLAPDNIAAKPVFRLGAQPTQWSMADTAADLVSLSDRGELTLHTAGSAKIADSNVKFATFVGDGRFISVRVDGVTYLRGVDVDHYLVAIVPGASGWVIVDHEGRYDGTVEGSKDVIWKGESGKLNLDQFFDAYYQPGLLSSYVTAQEKKVLAPTAGKPRDGLFAPPKVEIDFPEGKMKAGVEYKIVVVAESLGGDLQEEIRAFHNGKRLPPKSRIGVQKVQRDGRLLLLQIFAFMPEPGPNEFFAEARNSHDVATRSEVTRQVAEGTQRAGKLVLVGVGIDKYQVSRINLDFAGADVKTFIDAMNPNPTRNNMIASRMVMDAQATSQGIKGLFTELAALDQSDTLVLIMAGHGAVEDGEWYFLPHDVDVDNLAKSAISIRELQDALVASPAKRIFLMVDACNSGAGIDGFNRYRAFQRRFVQQVGRSAGISVLTATRRDQLAAEVAQLGHGLFTHVLLEGLSGSADTSPKDGRISAHELANFVGQNLEQRARPYLQSLGLSQSPAHFVIGADFFIASVRP